MASTVVTERVLSTPVIICDRYGPSMDKVSNRQVTPGDTEVIGSALGCKNRKWWTLAMAPKPG